NDESWIDAEAARAASQTAWEALETHIAAHGCIEPVWREADSPQTVRPEHVLEKAAMAAPDIILVADDERRYVDVNEAAAKVLGLPRDEIVGRRIDEFFSEAQGEQIPAAWQSFVGDGEQFGICELIAPGPPRRFAYRARANFAP